MELETASSGVRSKGQEEGHKWERTQVSLEWREQAGPEAGGQAHPHRTSEVPAVKVWVA